MPDEKSVAAAYVPFATIKSTLEKFTQAIPNQIDRTVFAGQSWVIQTQILAALKFLGLMTENGTPTEALRELSEATDEADRKKLIAEMLRRCYPALFDLPLNKATPAQLDAAIATYGVTGDTRNKATRFFLAAAEYSGVEVSQFIKNGSKNIARKRPNGNGGKRVVVETASEQPPQQPATASGYAPKESAAMKTIQLPTVGGTLTISGTFNPMGLKGKERDLVYKIVDLMDEFEGQTPNEA